MKFPGWPAKPSVLQSELDKIVAYLAEKDVGSQPQVTQREPVLFIFVQYYADVLGRCALN